MRGLMGSFAAMPLQDVVEVLARRKTTGTLTCERGTVRKTLYLKDGMAVGAASNDPREYLGQLLINFGYITEEQLAQAFRTQEATHVRLGEVLTLAGLVTSEIVRQTLTIKVRETLLDAFVWDSGVFYLDDGSPPPADDLDAGVALGEIGSEAKFRATAWQAFRAQFPSGAATLRVEESKVPAGIGPDTVDGCVLALAREGKTIDEIGLALHATDFHLYQRLYALAQQGVLSVASILTEAVLIQRESSSASGLVEEARVHLAAGRLVEAESAALRALAVAPQQEEVQAIAIESQRTLHEMLRVELVDPPRTPVLTVDPEEIASLELSSAEKYLLARCDGARHVGNLVEVAPLCELDVLKAIKKFASTGIVELR